MRADDPSRVDLTLETAKLGIEAEAFLRSSLGRYMVDRADMEIERAMVELVEADPEDARLNREIRNRIHVAKQIKQWIGEAINSGRVAHENLIEREALDT